MKRVLFVVVGFVVSSAHAAPSSIVGTWQMVLPDRGCIETYTFAENGVRTYKSAEETGESKFTISAKASSAGYYAFTDVIAASNGKPDCEGHSSPVGDSVRAFIRFGESGNTFFFCASESQDTCVGVFTRRSPASAP